MAIQGIKRPIFLILGFVCLGFGTAGAFLPLLPTVPFLLLAALCFSRGSESWNHWLHSHPKFGPALQDWHNRGVIRRPAKIQAVVLIAISFGINLWFLWTRPPLAILVATILSGSVIFILSRPSE